MYSRWPTDDDSLEASGLTGKDGMKPSTPDPYPRQWAPLQMPKTQNTLGMPAGHHPAGCTIDPDVAMQAASDRYGLPPPTPPIPSFYSQLTASARGHAATCKDDAFDASHTNLGSESARSMNVLERFGLSDSKTSMPPAVKDYIDPLANLKKNLQSRLAAQESLAVQLAAAGLYKYRPNGLPSEQGALFQSYDSWKQHRGTSGIELSSQESSNVTSTPRPPPDSQANASPYTCTYHSCTHRFDTAAELQTHKRHHILSQHWKGKTRSEANSSELATRENFMSRPGAPEVSPSRNWAQGSVGSH